MGGASIVSISVEPAVVAPGGVTRITIVADETFAGPGGLDVPVSYQQYPRVPGEDLIADAVDTMNLPPGRMIASADLRTKRGSAGGRVVVIANPGPNSISSTLTIDESPGSGAVRAVFTTEAFD